ncbi:MAG: diiron oxygenase [Planctomycetes bacterium]|nr:diiron oxygenase [Planctomycetota bacterium]
MEMQNYIYEDILEAGRKVNWQIEDIIGGDKKLDFSRRFLPESLARVEELAFLSEGEKRILSQIRGNAYLNIFGLVEEFILPFVMDHARPTLAQDDDRTRALLAFASEEAKHIQLFKRFREEFADGFGSVPDMIGPPEAVAKHVLSHHPLGVALVILHIEWMTQRHFLDSVVGDQQLDPQFKSLLRYHWMEEAQHAKLDTLMVFNIAREMDAAEISAGVEGYLKIGGFLDEGLKQQTEFDLAAFEKAAGRKLDELERDEFIRVQHQANRWTYLGTGMTHPKFLEVVGALSTAAREQLEEVAPVFC